MDLVRSSHSDSENSVIIGARLAFYNVPGRNLSLVKTVTIPAFAARLKSSAQRLQMRSCAQPALLLVLVFTLSAACRAASSNPTPTPTPTPCPKVSVTPEAGTETKRGLIRFSAKIEPPSAAQDATYNWIVNPESLTPDTRDQQTIFVDLTNADSGTIRATVAVSGLGSCPSQPASGAVTFSPAQASAEKHSEFYAKSPEAEWQRQADEIVEIQQRTHGYIYVVAHDQAGATAALEIDGHDDGRMTDVEFGARFIAAGYDPEASSRSQQDKEPAQTGALKDTPAVRLARRVKDYLVSKGVPEDHIIISVGEPRPQVTVELYLGPKGALLPAATAISVAPTVRDEDIDVMWGLLSQDTVGDLFGKRVRKQYYVIEVAIANKSGAELQLQSMAFSLAPGPGGTPPAMTTIAADYRFVRGTVLAERKIGTRSRTLSVITAASSTAMGFVPFFHVSSQRANFSQFVNILSNPVRAGFEMFVPDQTLDHLTLLDELAWRADGSVTLISTNTTKQTLLFFPKERLGLAKADRNKEELVFLRLGQLIVVGSAVQHVQSIRKTSP